MVEWVAEVEGSVPSDAGGWCCPAWDDKRRDYQSSVEGQTQDLLEAGQSIS